ncbi:helix-turn-helix domain-containing protein [Nocardia sp. GCM10030253]|uniref:helix-turn-helix domain-containing protein n=1 Tax=Nocardia sp. GCM10030253 TaxID=3273404 RepID=UPI0036335E53
MTISTQQPVEAPKDLINLRTAAALVAVDVKTIKNWIKAGDLQGFLVNGRMWRVQRDELLGLVRPAALSDSEGVA